MAIAGLALPVGLRDGHRLCGSCPRTMRCSSRCLLETPSSSARD